MSYRYPSPSDAHWPFYQHLKAGGTVRRDDKMNGVVADITLETLKGVPENIYNYGCLDLSILPRKE